MNRIQLTFNNKPLKVTKAKPRDRFSLSRIITHSTISPYFEQYSLRIYLEKNYDQSSIKKKIVFFLL